MILLWNLRLVCQPEQNWKIQIIIHKFDLNLGWGIYYYTNHSFKNPYGNYILQTKRNPRQNIFVKILPKTAKISPIYHKISKIVVSMKIHFLFRYDNNLVRWNNPYNSMKSDQKITSMTDSPLTRGWSPSKHVLINLMALRANIFSL